MVWLVFICGIRGTPFVMCTNEKSHPWCENTISHHGVELMGPLI